MLCFVVVMLSFIMNSNEVFIHIHQGCFAGTGAIVRLPQCQWSKPDGYGKISQCITTTKHSKAKTVCIFLGMYCMWRMRNWTSQQLGQIRRLVMNWLALNKNSILSPEPFRLLANNFLQYIYGSLVLSWQSHNVCEVGSLVAQMGRQ